MIVFACGNSRMVAGTAIYCEQIPLRPNAIFEAVLEDSSGTDVTATRIGEYRIKNPKVPIEFVIPYDPKEIQKSHTYTVRARIGLDDQALFATETLYPVLKQPDDVNVELHLCRTKHPVSNVQPDS